MGRALPIAIAAITLLVPGCLGVLFEGLDEQFAKNGPKNGPADVPWHHIEINVPTGQPMFQGDISHTGWFPDVTVPAAIEEAWTIAPWNLGEHSAAKGSPTRVDDVIYAGTDLGWVMAITTDGEVLWNTSIAGGSKGTHGTPLVHEGVVYIGDYHGYLNAINASGGESLWKTKLGGSVASSPIWYDGRIVVATETPVPSGILHVVSTNGTIVWADDTITNHPHSSVAIDPDLQIGVVGDNDGTLYAWDVTNIDEPERIWEYQTKGEIKAPIMIADGAAFFGSWDHSVYRVDVATGQLDWRFKTEHTVMGGAAIQPEAGIVYIGGHDREMHALDARSGEEIWSYRTDGRIIGQPTVTPEALVFGSFDGTLYAVNPLNGHTIWSHKVPGHITSAPLVRDDLIVFTDRSIEFPGGLYALRPADSFP